MNKANPTSPRFKNMEEYQKWKAERLAQLARKSVDEDTQSGSSVYCTTCGKQLPSNSRYCGYCGASQSASLPERPGKQPMSLKKVMLYTVLAVVGFGIVVAIYSNIDGVSPTPPPAAKADTGVDPELAAAVARATIARQVEEALLRTGMDARVTIRDNPEDKGQHIYLVISALTADRPFSREFVDTSNIISALKKAGFTDIEFSQCCGLEDEYIGHYDLQKGVFY